MDQRRMINRRLVNFDEEPSHIDDDDGGTDSDFDVCDRCGCIRAAHEAGTGGQCERCESCRAFVDAC